MGLARGYWNSGDTSFQAALSDTGALLLTKTNNFSPSDGYLAVMLDSVFGGSTYRDHVQANFYGPLAAGTYDRNGAGTLYSTASYVQMIRDVRAGLGNLAEWDIGMGLVGAATCGAGTAAWIDGVKAELNEHSIAGSYDVIGLAGALYGLALVNEDFDPTSGDLASASNLNDLGNILAGYQIDVGGFTYDAGVLTHNNESVQETAYAILALNQLGRGTYFDVIQGAADWLAAVQMTTGGWEKYPYYSLYGENNELTGEAIWGIHAVYVEDLYVSSSGYDMAFGYGTIPFATVTQAVSQIAGLGGTVYVAHGTYVEGPRIDIFGDVDIVGAGPGLTIIQPAGSTGSSGDARAWFLVDPDATLNLSGMSFDGAGQNIHQAFRWIGDGSVTDCTFVNIGYSTYLGFALVPFGGIVDVTGSTFENIGRVGVLYFGPGVTGSTYSGNTYVGKGAVDGLDYGVELGGGAVATIQYSDIRDNTAVASSDGSTSAGILVTDLYGPGTAATIMFNTLANNTTGIAVGYDATDASTVVARYNSMFGNEWGISSTAPLVDAALNWWGDADGPSGEGTGVGDAVSTNVIFSPWLGIDPDSNAGTVGVQLVSPMFFIVDDVGPAPTLGYLGTAIDASNTLAGIDTIEVRHGTYDASKPITDPVNIISETGSAAHTTLNGPLVFDSEGVVVGLPLKGFTLMGNVDVRVPVLDASTIHINWNDIYGSMVNNGGGTLDAEFNYWGTQEETVIVARITGAVDFDPFLPKNADDSYVDVVSILESGLAFDHYDAVARLWDAILFYGGDVGSYIANILHEAGDGPPPPVDPAANLQVAITLDGEAAGGGGGLGDGVPPVVIAGEPITGSFALTDPVTGLPINDAIVTVSLIGTNPDGSKAFAGFAIASYDELTGEYTFEIDTEGLAPGTYEIIFQTNAGQVVTLEVEIT